MLNGTMVRLMLAVLRVLYQRNGTLMERSCMHWTSDFVVARLLLAVRRLVFLMVRGLEGAAGSSREGL
jgi:hypothetical protein